MCVDNMDWDSIWKGIQWEQNEGSLAGGDFFKNADASWKGALGEIKTAFDDPGKFAEHIAGQFDMEGSDLGSGKHGEVGKALAGVIEGVGGIAGLGIGGVAHIGSMLDLSGDIGSTAAGRGLADMFTDISGANAPEGGMAGLGGILPTVVKPLQDLGGKFEGSFGGGKWRDRIGDWGDISKEWEENLGGGRWKDRIGDWGDISDSWDQGRWWTERLGMRGNIANMFKPPEGSTTAGSGGTTTETGTSATDDDTDAEVTEEEFEELQKSPAEQALEAQRRARIRRQLMNKQGKRSTIRTSGRGIRK